MKLEGSLDAFSLPDIFQLLSYTKKTGGLRLQNAGSHGVVHFVEGEVTGAASVGTRDRLARRLVADGLADADTVERSLAQGDAEGAGVLGALVASGTVQAEAARDALLAHVQEVAVELLGWATGEFAFAPDQANPDDVGLRVAPDELVAHAEARRAAWSAVAERLPAPDARLELRGADADVVVRPGQWALLRLAALGRTTGELVAEAVAETGADRVDVATALADLLDAGVLTPADAATPAAPAPAVRTAAPASAPAPTPARATAPAARSVVAAPEAPAEPAPSTVVTLPDPAPARPAARVREERAPSPTATAGRLGGAHVPGDVVPPRPEPFRPPRRPEFAESGPGVPGGRTGGVVGSSAVAAEHVVERDPNVNRSLLLRLIAGVRGL